jgi:hypothetical protein
MVRGAILSSSPDHLIQFPLISAQPHAPLLNAGWRSTHSQPDTDLLLAVRVIFDS